MLRDEGYLYQDHHRTGELLQSELNTAGEHLREQSVPPLTPDNTSLELEAWFESNRGSHSPQSDGGLQTTLELAEVRGLLEKERKATRILRGRLFRMEGAQGDQEKNMIGAQVDLEQAKIDLAAAKVETLEVRSTLRVIKSELEELQAKNVDWIREKRTMESKLSTQKKEIGGLKAELGRCKRDNVHRVQMNQATDRSVPRNPDTLSTSHHQQRERSDQRAYDKEDHMKENQDLRAHVGSLEAKLEVADRETRSMRLNAQSWKREEQDFIAQLRWYEGSHMIKPRQSMSFCTSGGGNRDNSVKIPPSPSRLNIKR